MVKNSFFLMYYAKHKLLSRNVIINQRYIVEKMLLTVAILSLLVNVALLCSFVFVVKKGAGIIADNIQAFASFFTSPSEDQPSDFGRVVDSVGQVVAQNCAVGVGAALKGSIGGTMKGVNAELEQVALNEYPQLAIMDAMPKSLKKNPLAAMGMQMILNSKLGAPGSAPGSPGGNGKLQPGENVKFNL